MPSIGLHFALTLFFLAACLKDEDFRSAMLLLPFGLLSDLDSYFGVHRATFHNLFVILIPLIGIIALKWLKGTQIKDRYFVVASALLAFHIFLDTFFNGVFFLYPVIETSYNPQFWLGLKGTGLNAIFRWIVPGIVGEVIYVTTPTQGVPEVSIISSGIELVILLFAVITFVSKFNANFFQIIYARMRR